MLKYQCKKCEATKELSRATLEVVHGKVRTREALCECGEYMREIEKDFDGFPCIKRTEPSLNKKRDRMWKDTKEKFLN